MSNFFIPVFDKSEYLFSPNNSSDSVIMHGMLWSVLAYCVQTFARTIIVNMILFFFIWRTCARRSLVVVFDIVRCVYAFVRVYVNAFDVAAAFDLHV